MPISRRRLWPSGCSPNAATRASSTCPPLPSPLRSASAGAQPAGKRCSKASWTRTSCEQSRVLPPRCRLTQTAAAIRSVQFDSEELKKAKKEPRADELLGAPGRIQVIPAVPPGQFSGPFHVPQLTKDRLAEHELRDGHLPADIPSGCGPDAALTQRGPLPRLCLVTVPSAAAASSAGRWAFRRQQLLHLRLCVALGYFRLLLYACCGA